MKMEKEIYLVFTRTGTILSRIIGFFSDGKYVHSSLSFDGSFRKMYSFGRTNPDNPFSGGFVEEDLGGGVYAKFSNSECLIYKVNVSEEQFEILQEEVERFQIEKDKYRYNLIGLIGVKVGIPVGRRYHYFCSQFVSEVLMNSQIYNVGKDPGLVEPDDLFSISNKEFVYEGYASNCILDFSNSSVVGKAMTIA